MPLQKIWKNDKAVWAVWHITEPLDFFISELPYFIDLRNEKITHPQKIKETYSSRILLSKIGLGAQIKCIEKTKEGKPFIRGLGKEISISHTQEYAAAIISKSEKCGIDIEQIHPRVTKIASRFLHSSELKWADESVEVLNLFWSAKETVYKWHGMGSLSFQNQIRIIKISPLSNQGILNCQLILEDKTIALEISYWIFNEYVLTLID